MSSLLGEISAWGSLAVESMTVISKLVVTSWVPSLTASFAEYSPGWAYEWLVVNPVPVLPSPNVHVNVIASASGSEEPTALNVMLSPALTEPDGSTDMFALGGLLLPRTSIQPASAVKIIKIVNSSAVTFLSLISLRWNWYEINPAITC